MYFINPAFTCGTFCILPWEIRQVPRDLACERNWLNSEESLLTAWRKSAEGKVGEGNEPEEKSGSLISPKARTEGKEKSLRAEKWNRIRQAA